MVLLRRRIKFVYEFNIYYEITRRGGEMKSAKMRTEIRGGRPSSCGSARSDGEVGGVGAMVADVAEGVTPDREACPGGFVTGTLIPVVADIYEGQLLGVLLGLFLRDLGVGPGALLL